MWGQCWLYYESNLVWLKCVGGESTRTNRETLRWVDVPLDRGACA